MDFDHEPVEQPVIDALVAEMREVYLRPDGRPWVIGFSGGKDSSAVVQLTYRMLMALPAEQRTKPVYVVSSDTLVENPAVATWLDKCHAELRDVATRYDLPVTVVKVTPDPKQSFWVCLIGRGYPAPTQDFRWCTGRLKIEPSETWVRANIDKSGRILQLLGSRKKESKARGASIEAHAIEGKFGTCGSLTEGISFQPIQEWDNDNVWEYLRLFPKPWGGSNEELFEMYQGAHGGECVLDFDRRTASCGGSRFGCFVCTVVPEDISMRNMVRVVTPEYAPLLAFRDKILRYRNDYSKRDPIGRNGRLRLNCTARTMAAKVHAGEDEASIDAFETGARWAEREHYKPSGQDWEAAAGEVPTTQLLAFLAGVRWTEAAMTTGASSTDVTPGPYLLGVRAEFLRDLFEIEKGLPGFKTVTDDDIRWIKHWWEHDGGDPDLADTIRAEVLGN
ncbi:MAG TPA: DNA phosphorothioation system sulfurtransferase DndC [Symbiobacteriaceae bacterium]|jgi:DNA sulfur modification protein DndC